MSPGQAITYVQRRAKELIADQGILLNGAMLQVDGLEEWAPLIVGENDGKWHLIKCVEQRDTWSARYEYRTDPPGNREFYIQMGGSGRWEALAGSRSKDLDALRVMVDQLNREPLFHGLDRNPYFRIHPVGV